MRMREMKGGRSAWAAMITMMFWARHEAEGKRITFEDRHELPAALVENVMVGAGQIVESHLAGCHLLLVSPDLSTNLGLVHRIMEKASCPMVLLKVNSRAAPKLMHMETGERPLEGGVSLRQAELWSKSKPSCRGLLLDYMDGKITTFAWFLLWSRRWLQPETKVLVMGNEREVDNVLSHSAFRNTRLTLYMAAQVNSHGGRGAVQIYRRCLYCNNGNAGVQRLYHWNLDNSVPQDLGLFTSTEYMENFNGHQFRIVTMTYFPYINYERVSDVPGTVVRLTDSLNTRMVKALAPHLNFTYEVREPEDGLWGLETSAGNWTGTVGTLQHEKADFSMELTITLQREAVVDFCRAYIGEDMAIMSLKPTLLPEYLGLIRPFEGTVWVAVMVGTMVWGVTLWVLLRLKQDVSERHHLSLASSFFYGWGLLLEDQPYDPPANIAGQSDGRQVVLGLLQLQATFYMLAMGLAAGGFFFLAEHVVYNKF